jgi:hypothetical protein
VLTSVVLNALTTIGGQLVYRMNPAFWRITAPALVSFDGRTIGHCDGGSGAFFTDALSCSTIVWDRSIQESFATSLVNPVLTRTEGFLDIRDNSALIRVDFASLYYVGGYLVIAGNPALTFASLSRLSQVQGNLGFCLNAPSFAIPNAVSGTAAPPGLTSVAFKGSTTTFCDFQQGSGACNNVVTCP